NLDAPDGELSMEVLDEKETPIEGFRREECVAVRGDRASQGVSWKKATDLERLAGKPVRFRFHLRQGGLYAFWVSPEKRGASHGYVAAGGPPLTPPPGPARPHPPTPGPAAAA